MGRDGVLQNLLKLFEKPNYLEIGVDKGHTFHKLVATKKTAVDPLFSFDIESAKINPENNNCSYYQLTSDSYFFCKNPLEKFDVIFIDGLHTFEQTLRDLLNSINSLSDGGIIVIDDVIPASYAASLPSLNQSRAFWEATANPDGSWMGDVYKVIMFLEQFITTYSYGTISENHGQTVIWKQQRELSNQSSKSIEVISRASYADLMLDLSVMRILPFDEIFSEIAAAIPIKIQSL